MGSVVQRIQKLGIKVIHIPGGCTGLCQPFDVGINKPFKCRVRQRWEEWMISGIKRTGTVESPLRTEVSVWVAEVSLEMRYLPMLKTHEKNRVQLVRGGGSARGQCGRHGC